jgi:hypothetical protein
MAIKSFLLRLLCLCPLLSLGASAADDPEPLLSSWLTDESRQYARIYQSDADRAADRAVTTWARGQSRQALPAYAGVMQVSFSTDWVYLSTSGLATHVMGPWYLNADRTRNFPGFPANSNALYRFPRTPVIPQVKTLTHLGPIGYFVDGVAAFDNTDAFSYSVANGTDGSPVNGFPGDRVWNREAYANEGVTFDAAYAHQARATHHYHANAPAVRYQLGDHVDFDPVTKTYIEKSTPPTAHSPIVAWLADGLPVYGPYGYASPLDPTSGVRAMVSGYVKRDGLHGTTDLPATGRTSLPMWAARAQGKNEALPIDSYGPPVNPTYALGHYIEDYDYLGDLGYVQGRDFDLNASNVRYCVTPEFPQGTYAYFLTIEPDGTPVFPNMIGRWFFGDPRGGNVRAIRESVTSFALGGVASPLKVTAAPTGDRIELTWTSVEGATYQVETSSDGTTWAMLLPAVISAGGTTTKITTPNHARQYRITLIALATYDSGSVGPSGVGTSGIGQLAIGL